MSRKHRRRKAPKVVRRTAPGSAPGTVIVDPSQPKPVITVLAYGAGEVVEMQVESPAEAQGADGAATRHVDQCGGTGGCESHRAVWRAVRTAPAGAGRHGERASAGQGGRVWRVEEREGEVNTLSPEAQAAADEKVILFVVLRMVYCQPKTASGVERSRSVCSSGRTG